MRFLATLLGAAAVASVLAAPAAPDAAATTTTKPNKRKSKFLFTGVNESGAEFGSGALPGQLNKDYTWPAKSTIDVGKTYLGLRPSIYVVDQGVSLLTAAGHSRRR